MVFPGFVIPAGIQLIYKDTCIYPRIYTFSTSSLGNISNSTYLVVKAPLLL